MKIGKDRFKAEVQDFVLSHGAFKCKVATPFQGFEYAIDGCHPIDLMEDCRSVIVFAIYVGNDYYRTIRVEGKTMGDDRIGYIFRDWLSYKLAEFLMEKGFKAVVPTGFFDSQRKIAKLSFKLAAYEAGLGVFGKSGLILTKEYGPRINIGVVLTNASLEPDAKVKFNPCTNCNVCAKACPAGAIRTDLNPPASHDREKCIKFILNLRRITKNERFFCGYCFDKCPVGETCKRGFFFSRYKKLDDLKPCERKKLINDSLVSL
jgi:epoxyqueuosine reductase QueG